MKKLLTTFVLIITVILVGCARSPKDNIQISEDHSTSSSDRLETHIHTFARFSGCFTATVEQLLPDYYALPGKTIAYVHYFQDSPFLLQFHEDMTDKLIEGQAYVFEFNTFDVDIPESTSNVDVKNYMYSIEVSAYRPAKEDEMGLSSLTATVEIIHE